MQEILSATKVKSFMQPHPHTVSPDCTLREAAAQMKALDCGILPVGNEQQPEGVITDRDIVTRAVAEGKDINVEKVRDFMTAIIHSCNAEETIEEAADKMREYQVSRLLVEEDGEVCGIITFGSMLRKSENKEETANVVEHAVKSKAA